MKSIKRISESLRTRQVKYGGYAVMVTFALIIGLILVNLIFQQFSPQVDLTSNKLFSLSEQTIQVVDALKSPVTIYGLWQEGQESREIKEVVDLYTVRSRLINLEVVDPDRNPGLVLRFDKDNAGIDRGSLVVEGEKGFKIIRPMDMYDFSYSQSRGNSVTGISVERRLTSALLYVGSGETPSIYEIVGHGEIPLSQLGMQETIERENYALKQLDLIQSGVPENAAVLILNGPRSDLTAGETAKISEYLEKGGRLLALVDYRSEKIPNLDDMFSSYGIRFDYGVVVELNKNYTTGPSYQTIPYMVSHDITTPLGEKRVPVVLPLAMGISELSVRRRTTELVPLLRSSDDSYLQTNLENESTERGPEDVPGPLVLGMAVTDPQYAGEDGRQTRIAAIGCGMLLEPVGFFQQIPGNIDLFMNSLTWLADRPETLSVRSKSLFVFPLRMTQMQILIFGLLFVVVIPLALFISGFVTWLKRRHL
jgi:hypothetical protein